MPNSYYIRTLNLIPFTLARGADLNAEAQLVENAFDLLPPPRPGGGGFALLDGSVSNPALQFQTSSNTGWYLASPGVMAFSVGGTQVATISSSGFGGLGLGLTQLNASSLTTGTIPTGRFPDPLPALSGANLTNLNASNLTSGTVPNARISGNYTNITGIGNTAAQLLFGTQGHLTVQSPTANQSAAALTVNGMTVSSGNVYTLTMAASSPAYVVAIVRNHNASGPASFEVYGSNGNVNAIVLANQSFGAVFGSSTNHGTSIWTNTTPRLTISNVGALTLNAPESGNHTINGAVTFSSTISGDGSGLTNLNASNLSSGTVPNARVSGNYTNITGIGNTAAQLTFATNGQITVNQPTTSSYALTVNAQTVGSGSTYALDVRGNAPTSVYATLRNTNASGSSVWEVIGANGTVQTLLVSASSSGYIGTATGHQFGIITNNVQRFFITSAGAATIEAPSSGNHTINGPVTFGGAVTLSSTISGNGSGLTNLNASNLASGTVPDARFPATLPAISGANLTNLNASNLASGTVPDARFPATLPAISGANLTNLNASNLASGTVPDARFPATLPAISGANLTNLNASNLASGTIPAARFPDPLPTLSGANLTNLNASNLASGTIPNARFPDPLPALSGANLTNLNASNLASGTVPNARISGAYTNITAIGNGASHLSIAANGNITCSAQVLATANVVAKQGASGNAHYFLRANTDVDQGILFWDASDDSVIVARYNSTGSSLENYYSLTGSGTAVVRSSSSSKTVNYTFDHNGLAIQQPNTDPGYLFLNNVNGERVRLYASNSRLLIISTDNDTTQHVTLGQQGDYVAQFRSSATNCVLGAFGAGTGAAFLLLGNASNGERVRLYGDNNRQFAISVDSGTSNQFVLNANDAVFNLRALTTPISVSFSSSLTINARQSNVFYVGTLTGNITSFTINNPGDGQTINVRFVQDGTGSRTVALPSGAVVSGSLNSAANSVTWLVITYVSSASRWEGTWTRIS